MSLLVNESLTDVKQSADALPVNTPDILHIDEEYSESRKLLKQIFSNLSESDSSNKIKEIEELLAGKNAESRPADGGNIDKLMKLLHDKYTAIRLCEKNAAYNISEFKELTCKNLNVIRDLNSELRKMHSLMEFSASRSTRALDIIKDPGAEITTGTSYAELWGKISEAISNIKLHYVDFYAQLMKKYTEMFQSYNENVQKASSDAVSSGKDGNNVSFSTSTMKKGYDAFKKYRDGCDLGEVKMWEKMTEKDRANIRITLEPAFEIAQDGKISFNLVQYLTINDSLPEAKDNQTPTASYHAWLASFNAAGSALQSNMQSFAQRYSQANSTFDNLNKVLSGVISALGESARDVLKSIG